MNRTWPEQRTPRCARGDIAVMPSEARHLLYGVLNTFTSVFDVTAHLSFAPPHLWSAMVEKSQLAAGCPAFAVMLSPSAPLRTGSAKHLDSAALEAPTERSH